MKGLILCGALMACVLVGGIGWDVHDAQAADTGSHIIELHQTDALLREVYAKDKHVKLPRMAFFDSKGRLLVGEVGLRGGLGHRLARALDKDKPLDTPLSLARVLDGVVDGNDEPVSTHDLPDADGYVVDYWAEWCAPCREMARDIKRQMKRWQRDGKQVVWIKIESDPQKLPENR